MDFDGGRGGSLGVYRPPPSWRAAICLVFSRRKQKTTSFLTNARHSDKVDSIAILESRGSTVFCAPSGRGVKQEPAQSVVRPSIHRWGARYPRRRTTSLSAAELPNAPSGPNDPSVLRFRRLWPLLLNCTPARKILPRENGHRGEAPKCIYPHAALLEHVGYSGHPFE